MRESNIREQGFKNMSQGNKNGKKPERQSDRQSGKRYNHQSGAGNYSKLKVGKTKSYADTDNFDENKAWNEFKRETGYKESKGKTENKDRVGSKGRNERKEKSESKGSSEFRGRSESQGRIDSRGRSESQNRNDNRDRSESHGRIDSRGRSESQGRNDSRGRSESQGRNDSISRSESQNRNDSRGRSESQGRIDSRGRSESQGRNDSRGRSESLNRNDNRGRSESQGRNDNRGRSESQGRNNNRGRNESQGRNESFDRSEIKDRSENKGRYESQDRSAIKDRRINIEDNGKGERAGQDKNRYDINTQESENKRSDGRRNFIKGNEIKTNSLRSEYGHDKKTPSQGACPYLRECGGCNIMDQSYEAHLKEKQKTVDTLLKNYCKVEPIIGMEQPKHYRHKVHVIFDHDKKGNPISGVYEEGTHRVVPIENCLIHNQKADAIIATIRGMLKSFKILTYDEDSEYGLLRHVMVRTGFYSNEIMVVLVLASPILPSKNNFVKALRDKHPEITTVVINVNDKKTSMVLGNKEHVIYGKGYIEDSLCGKTFRISPKSFYQVNPLQTEVIYKKAIEFAGLTGNETVIDAYCGIGTIGIIAADHAAKVIGVELNKDAVRDAVTNGKLNGVTNVDFYNNDAGKFMSQMAEKKEKVDVVFMDPPRTGSNEQFMDAVAVLKPDKVVYISCNPVSLERDLQYFTKKGYKAKSAVPVDMFPWTGHVETVVLMTKCGQNHR